MGILVHPFLWVMQGSYHQAQGVGFLGPKPQKRAPESPTSKPTSPRASKVNYSAQDGALLARCLRTFREVPREPNSPELRNIP